MVDTLKRDAGITALASADDYADGAVSAADLATGDVVSVNLERPLYFDASGDRVRGYA